LKNNNQLIAIMSREGFSEKLGLFLSPPTEVGIENKTWLNIRPTSQITEGGIIDFTIPPNPVKYMDLHETLLLVTTKVTRRDGKKMKEAEFATPINLFLHSLWAMMDVSIQQISVSSGISTRYPYKAVLDYILKTPETVWKTLGAFQMYYRDKAGVMNGINPTDTKFNDGIFSRHARSKDCKTFEMEGPLYSDIFQQKRLLLNGLELGIKLYPSSDNFRLMSATSEYKVEVTDAVLKVCYVKVSPGILLGHSEAMKIGPAKYFFDESVIKSYAIASGQYSMTVDDLFQGDVPKRLTLCLVSSESLSGSCTKNPFNFKHYDVNFCGFYVDGQSCPTQPLQPNFAQKNYVEAYTRLFRGEVMHGITYEEFCDGYTICF
jgi:hypothetical protein